MTNSPPLPPSERTVLGHAGFVSISASWLLGGRGPHGEWIVAALAAPSIWFLFAEGRARLASEDRTAFLSMVRTLAPLLALALLVLVSALNPSHQEAYLVDGSVLRPVPYLTWLPSSARPVESLRTLICLGALACTGISLLFCVHSRRGLRALLVGLTANGAILAVLGTVQRHLDAPGPFFGYVAPVNPWWFGSFLYYGHWGAFATLSLAASLGLVFHSLYQGNSGRWSSGPGPLFVLAALLIAATGPFSGSRGATVLVFALLIPAIVLAAVRLLRRRPEGRSTRGFWVLVAVTLAGSTLMAFQSKEILTERVTKTTRQIEAHLSGDYGYGRSAVRADTWKMTMEHPFFGWGLGSFGGIFIHFSSIIPDSNGQITTYEDAVCDPLQSIAEIGFVGTGLLALSVLLPLIESARRAQVRVLPGWLLTGCGLVAAYSLLEFPLACPAVVALWWVLFFAALRSLQLTKLSTTSNSNEGQAIHPHPSP